MPLIDEVTAEYRRQHPTRQGRPVPFTEVEVALLAVLDRKLAGKLDRLLPKAAPDE
jgi:hypothetical protein